MNSKEKIEYIRNCINELLAISPSGPVFFKLVSLRLPENEDAVIFSIGEQKLVLAKLEELGEIKNLKWRDESSLWLEVVFDKKVHTELKKFEIFHVMFAAQESRIIVNAVLNIEIPVSSNQFHLCRYMFLQSPDEKIKQIDIESLKEWSGDSERGVYDAMLAVNKLFSSVTGVKKIFQRSNSHYYFNETLANKIDKEKFLL